MSNMVDERRIREQEHEASGIVEAAAAPNVTEERKPFSFWMAFVSLCMLAFISSLDATSLAVALPTITEQLGGSTIESFWASIIFMLGVAITQPIYVSLSDVLGRKLPLYASIVLFTVGAIVFAVAQTMSVLVVGRLLQGLGAGGLGVLDMIILSDITTLKERAMYIGLLGLPVAAGSTAGPLVGAGLTQDVTWRWIGWINLPFAGVALGLAVFFLHLRPLDGNLVTRLGRLDWIGMLLYAMGATAFTLPLSWGDALYAWSSWRTILPLIIGSIVLGIFAIYERKATHLDETGVLPYRVFGNATAVASIVTGLIHGLLMYTVLLYLPLFFQAVFLEAPVRAAISILPACCLNVAACIAAPIIIETTRRYRVLLWFAWALSVLMLGLWCRVGRESSRAELYVLQSIMGIGVGVVFTGTQSPMQASVRRVDDTGLAIGLLVSSRLFGALLGLSIAATAFTSVFAQKIADVGELPQALKALEDSGRAIEYIPILRTLNLPLEELDSVIAAYERTFQVVWIILTCFAGVGFLISLFIKELTLEKEEVGRQAFDHPSMKENRVQLEPRAT